MKQWIYRAYSQTPLSTVAWALFGTGLRIITYHGLCRDELADQPWMPRYFVKQSRFEEQLRYLATRTRLLPLSEAVRLLAIGRLPKRATAVTFDDGYANNLTLALPLLVKYHVPATIFLATGHTRSGKLLACDRLRLIHLQQTGWASDEEFYRLPIDALDEMYRADWEQVQSSLSPAAFETLRPLTVTELKSFPTDLIEFGAHTRSHCILCHETPERRKAEIQDSLLDITEWTGNTAPLFSYPTGSYGEIDRRMLTERSLAAVTTEMGRNHPGCDSFALKRCSVAMNHTVDAFVAEVTGLRALLNRVRTLRLHQSAPSGLRVLDRHQRAHWRSAQQ